MVMEWNIITLAPSIFSSIQGIPCEPFCDLSLACPHLSAISGGQSTQLLLSLHPHSQGRSYTYRADKTKNEVLENVRPKWRSPTGARSKHVRNECIRNVEIALLYTCIYGYFQSRS